MALADFPRVDDFGDGAAEARACRTDCALFDFSFLECARLTGVGARPAVETFSGRSLATLAPGEIYYALRVNGAGSTVADLTIWRTGEDAYEVMSGRRDDVADLLAQANSGVDVADLTERTATFAVQGPATLEVLSRIGDVSRLRSLGYFGFCETQLNRIPCRLGRLGYTGEAGFEIIAPRAAAPDLWQALSAYARPAGFVAADMLRIEAGFVLFTNEFRLPASPREAGLERFYPPAGQQQPQIRLVSFTAEADTLCLPWQPSGDLRRPSAPDEIAVTSACRSNAAGGILGLGYVRTGTDEGLRLHDPSATFRNIRRTPLPFYDNAKSRPRLPWR